MSLFSSLFPEISNWYKDKNARELKEIQEKARIKKDSLDRSWKLINAAAKQHGEKILYSVEGSLPNRNKHITPIALTQNRILFTTIDAPAFVLVDIPYVEIYELRRNRNNFLGTDIVRLEDGIYRTHYIWIGGNCTKEDLYKEISHYSQDKLGKAYGESTTNKTRYINHCWNCRSAIDSYSNERCPVCKMFICSKCRSCFCNRKL